MKICCFTCNKAKATSKCAGCLKDFCFTHLSDHRQELANQLDDIEVHRDLFRQALNEQTTDPQTHPLIKKIDQWEQDSINKIHETVKEVRQVLFQHTLRHTNQLEEKLNLLTNQIRACREEDDIIETDLSRWHNELIQLNEQFIKPQNIIIQYDSIPLVNKIHVDISSSKVHTIDEPIKSNEDTHINTHSYPQVTYPFFFYVIWDAQLSIHFLDKTTKNSFSYVHNKDTSTKPNGKIIQLSKALSWLLRHAVIKEGLQFQYDGYVFVKDVLKHPTFANKYTIEDIHQCVETNEKKRFALQIDRVTGQEMIRAQLK
ncbi:unnamed protein product [Adineta steineri]|uniref:2'-phosphotransferase n=1 Tax=Adineta steineri TaxID=433720 RepID=A0A813W0V8_9BILA|nr:unnamed protein product [Adineta steineri]CAF1328950.1 unnamed protein product [Adineta steineri]